MKAMNYLAMMAIAASMMGGFTSCERDIDLDEAMVLSGEWQGNFCMSYCTTDRHGVEVWYDADYSRLVFEPNYDYATRGTGYEVDYYMYGPYESEYFAFRWRIRDGRIIINYLDNPELDVYISDYHIDNDYLWGHFTESGKKFQLYKRFDHYDWTPYVNNDHAYNCRDSWYENAPSSRAATIDELGAIDVSSKTEYPILYHGPRPAGK